MKLITSFDEMRDAVKEHRRAGDSIGLVPTMGFFHAGHVSLMESADHENDMVVVSIFVNPTQFGPGEDFEDYPRNLDRDMEMAEQAGADYIFHPAVEDMYPRPYLTYISVEDITEGLCGAKRRGHFTGVATVVAKLFNIIPADRAYFGLKDAQQVRVIEKMVEDLNFNIEIAKCPTIRESDGLALSSRNMYLNGEERSAAAILYRSLQAAGEMISRGERDASAIIAGINKLLDSEELIEPEYVEVVDYRLLHPLEELRGEVLIALAARVGKARLIDNLLINLAQSPD